MEVVAHADAVFLAGGDGTFLVAAEKIRDYRAVVGFNTDPMGYFNHIICIIYSCYLLHFIKFLMVLWKQIVVIAQDSLALITLKSNKLATEVANAYIKLFHLNDYLTEYGSYASL